MNYAFDVQKITENRPNAGLFLPFPPRGKSTKKRTDACYFPAFRVYCVVDSKYWRGRMDMPFIDVKASCPITAESQPGPGSCPAARQKRGEPDAPLCRRVPHVVRWGAGRPHCDGGRRHLRQRPAPGSRAVELCKETLGAETVYFKLAQTTDWAW